MSTELPIFRFETDFAGTLRCIPMCVRFKLDMCGVKLSLKQWNCFTHEERLRLVAGACDTPECVQSYRTDLVALIENRTSSKVESVEVDAQPPWSDARQVPTRIIDYAAALHLTVPPLEQWATLGSLERFALFKLTRPGHDNDNFLPAMREFGLVQ